VRLETIAKAMIAAIKAYSMDVAPSSSAANVMGLDRVIWERPAGKETRPEIPLLTCSWTSVPRYDDRDT
jgi:hypothetical protein